jgi:uncharacterized integral membrane protein
MPKPSDAGERRFKLTPKMVVVIVLAVLALIFVFQNTGKKRVSLLFWHINAPMWFWLLALLAAGFVVGSMFPWFRRRKAAKEPEKN